MRQRATEPDLIYQRTPGGVWWCRFTVAGHETRQSLRTRDKRTALREAARLKDEAVGRVHRGETKKYWKEAVVEWARDLVGKVEPSTARRYGTSIKVLACYFKDMMVHEIGKAEIKAFVKARRQQVKIATVRRDLQALSSLLGFCDDENWRDGNPARDLMHKLKERRDPIILPPQVDIDAVLADASPSLAALARASLLTGARQGELANAIWTNFHGHQLTLIGKGNKRRVIDLPPNVQEFFRAIPRHIKSPVIFHVDGARRENPATFFSRVVKRVAKRKEQAGEHFVRFRFHDLRHAYAVRFLKDGGSIYMLQKILGHTSVKTTEIYLEYLSPDEQLRAKGETAQNTAHDTRSAVAV